MANSGVVCSHCGESLKGRSRLAVHKALHHTSTWNTEAHASSKDKPPMLSAAVDSLISPEFASKNPIAKACLFFGLTLIAVGVFFGVKPVHVAETSLYSFGDSVDCGTAWLPNNDDLTSFGKRDCDANGRDLNRTLSFVFGGIGLVMAIAGPRVFNNDTLNLWRRQGDANTKASVSDLYPCPFCAEPIRRAAIICRFCGRDLQSPSS